MLEKVKVNWIGEILTKWRQVVVDKHDAVAQLRLKEETIRVLVARERIDGSKSTEERCAAAAEVAKENLSEMDLLRKMMPAVEERAIPPIAVPEAIDGAMRDVGETVDPFELAWEQRKQEIAEQGLKEWDLLMVKREMKALWDAKTVEEMMEAPVHATPSRKRKGSNWTWEGLLV